MKTTITVLVSLAFVCFVFGGIFINTSNSEIEIRSLIEAKQKDNKNEYDAMWKKIAQVAEVTEGQKNALMEIFTSYANARADKSSNLAMRWIKESVPNVDTTTFNNLQNIITSARDSFVLRQKELIDLKREHDLLLRRFPSGVILQILGRKEISIQVITSTRTENTFESGTDDDINVFSKK